MKSNCARAAWEAYKQDPKHVRMAFGATLYSKWVGKVLAVVQFTARTLLIAWFYVFTWLHLFAFERWPHWYWCARKPCGAKELVPTDEKRRRWTPPTSYEGEVIDG